MRSSDGMARNVSVIITLDNAWTETLDEFEHWLKAWNFDLDYFFFIVLSKCRIYKMATSNKIVP